MFAATHESQPINAAQASSTRDVSLVRLYVLRAAYLLLVVGLGGMIVPDVVSHPLISRGVIPSLLWRRLAAGIRRPQIPVTACAELTSAFHSKWTLAP